MKRSQIQDWNKWTAPARKFLDEMEGEKINLGDLIVDYHAGFMALQNHLWCLILSKHHQSLTKLIDEMDKLRIEKSEGNIDLVLPFRLSELRYLRWIMKVIAVKKIEILNTF